MTTNEIAQYADAEVLPAATAIAPAAANAAQSRADQLADLRAEAEFLAVANGLAEQACKGQLVAAHFRGKPDDGAIAIAYGASLGWHWTKSLQDVYVVNGKPSIQSKEMRELMIRAGHEVWEEEVGPRKVVLAGRRRGSDIVVRVEWTIEKAEKAGYTKSNPNYQKVPENMLYARCTTDLAKRLAPDALSGLGIVEDLQDQPIRATVERVTGPRGVAALGAKLGVSAELASNAGAKVGTAQASEPGPAPEVAMATPEQQQRVGELLTVEKLDTRKQKLDYLEGQFGRKFTSAANLTFAEADQLIAFLEQAQVADASAQA